MDAKLPPNATFSVLGQLLTGVMCNFRPERAIGMPVLARFRIEQQIAPILALMHAQVWERGFKRCQDQLRCRQYVARPFPKIAESDQSLAAFARATSV
jgi:hypothetical protein